MVHGPRGLGNIFQNVGSKVVPVFIWFVRFALAIVNDEANNPKKKKKK